MSNSISVKINQIGEDTGPDTDDPRFVNQISWIRARFVQKLVDEIDATVAALTVLAGDDTAALAAVDAAYRRFHDISGIGATIGFQATGRAARILDAILAVPFRELRGLSGRETAKLSEGLDSLRAAARTESHHQQSRSGS